eukprot:CAMPEP_0114244244 /NCGR_PEP_ID=MMETSP0058-20121206/11233_1 /TAXON_ID=36894 /ORGANISM="Pyramimonas parkeae, CCMP726" /LENGTH=106 /DNA_ID=CAMNT_0001357165 /DNA_START=916 /DNA_END=1236 /DNA_ORIENTATION=-
MIRVLGWCGREGGGCARRDGAWARRGSPPPADPASSGTSSPSPAKLALFEVHGSSLAGAAPTPSDTPQPVLHRALGSSKPPPCPAVAVARVSRPPDTPVLQGSEGR